MEAEQIGYSGTTQDAGLVRLAPGGAIITASLFAQYNTLAKRYGSKLPKPIAPGDGTTAQPEGLYFIDNEHLVALGVMTNLARESSKIKP